tara:strand:+ start:503 stop:727 length:225 start_codon:yes stop_codon:yes gene_type:complete
MAFTQSSVQLSVETCIAKFYKKYIEDSQIGREDPRTFRVLQKLKVIHNLSLWLDFSEEEYEKIFCFISECKHTT